MKLDWLHLISKAKSAKIFETERKTFQTSFFINLKIPNANPDLYLIPQPILILVRSSIEASTALRLTALTPLPAVQLQPPNSCSFLRLCAGTWTNRACTPIHHSGRENLSTNRRLEQPISAFSKVPRARETR